MATSRTRFFLLAAVVLVSGITLKAEVRPIPTGGFVVTHEVLLPGSPETIFDAVTGDISGWWDHSLSEAPKALYIEPKPGGGFYEIFDDEGNGALHATVIYADRGKLLRFVGPLGFSGSALSLVNSYEFEPRANGDSTLLKLKVSAAGEVAEGWSDAVDEAWHHFLFERLKPYVEAGRHRSTVKEPNEVPPLKPK
jgi:hypothetical protein